MTGHGLNESRISILKAVLSVYAEKIDKVALFGSRAGGKYRDNSDIDLVIYGDLTEAENDSLRTLFDESLLPVTVDIQRYRQIENDLLKSHIDRTATLLFTKNDLAPHENPKK